MIGHITAELAGRDGDDFRNARSKSLSLGTGTAPIPGPLHSQGQGPDQSVLGFARARNREHRDVDPR